MVKFLDRTKRTRKYLKQKNNSAESAFTLRDNFKPLHQWVQTLVLEEHHCACGSCLPALQQIFGFFGKLLNH